MRGRSERGRTPRRSSAAARACGTHSAPRPPLRSAGSAPPRARRAAAVANHRVIDLEAATPRDRQVRALDVAKHRRTHPRPKGNNRLHVAAVFVAEWKPVEQVLDGHEARAFEVRGFSRTYALEELKRSFQRVTGQSQPVRSQRRSAESRPGARTDRQS